MSGNRRSSKRGRSRSKSRCPKGQILRKGYCATRKRSGSRKKVTYCVKPTCIKDLGKPGKGPKLWSVTPGLLGKYGYTLKKLAEPRRKTLKRAVRAEGYNEIIKRLVAVSNYVKLSQPGNYRKYRGDIEWLKKNKNKLE